MRDAGVIATVQDLAGPTVVFFALVTQLGDLWFLVLVTTLAYWLDGSAPLVGHGLSRERTGIVLGLLVGAVALVVVLKPLFAFERPPGFDVPAGLDLVPPGLHVVYTDIATASGYGFPSGHALASTIVWGGLAWAVRVGTVRRRVATAGTVVVLVALSRVVLGVHFPRDVLAGVLIGVGYLAVVVRGLETPRNGFLAATAVALVGTALAWTGVLAGGVTVDLAAAVGLCLGATVAWYVVGETVCSLRPNGDEAVTAALGIVIIGPVLAAPAILESVFVAAIATTVGGALLISWPLIGHRLDDQFGDREHHTTGDAR